MPASVLPSNPNFISAWWLMALPVAKITTHVAYSSMICNCSTLGWDKMRPNGSFLIFVNEKVELLVEFLQLMSSTPLGLARNRGVLVWKAASFSTLCL